MSDLYANESRHVWGPLEQAVSVTPANTDLLATCRAVYVGGAGNLVVRFAADPTTDVTLTAIAPGVWHPMRLVRIGAATTATGVLVGY